MVGEMAERSSVHALHVSLQHVPLNTTGSDPLRLMLGVYARGLMLGIYGKCICVAQKQKHTHDSLTLLSYDYAKWTTFA